MTYIDRGKSQKIPDWRRVYSFLVSWACELESHSCKFGGTWNILLSHDNSETSYGPVSVVPYVSSDRGNILPLNSWSAKRLRDSTVLHESPSEPHWLYHCDFSFSCTICSNDSSVQRRCTSALGVRKGNIQGALKTVPERAQMAWL